MQRLRRRRKAQSRATASGGSGVATGRGLPRSNDAAIPNVLRHSGARVSANPESRTGRSDRGWIPGLARGLSSGRASRGPVGAIPE
jgi:hypothetical protein